MGDGRKNSKECALTFSTCFSQLFYKFLHSFLSISISNLCIYYKKLKIYVILLLYKKYLWGLNRILLFGFDVFFINILSFFHNQNVILCLNFPNTSILQSISFIVYFSVSVFVSFSIFTSIFHIAISFSLLSFFFVLSYPFLYFLLFSLFLSIFS